VKYFEVVGVFVSSVSFSMKGGVHLKKLEINFKGREMIYLDICLIFENKFLGVK
jgi:hypothetical protein